MSFLTLGDNSGSQRVYLDHNATTPLAAFLPAQIQNWVQLWGNPSSIHQTGRGPKSLMREARRSIAGFLGCDPLEIVFTSCGSEANNLALKGAWAHLRASGSNRKQIIISDVEHPSLRKTAEYLRDHQGAELTVVPVRRDGSLDLDFYKSQLSENTALVSIMMANNETGVVYPIRKLAEAAQAVGALFHTDAVQGLGKIPFHLRTLGVDWASFSGHKFYALKGVGVLYCKRGTSLHSLLHGGGQERHRRAGTENVLAIASLGAMCEYREQVLVQAERIRLLRDEFESRVLNEIPHVSVTAAESPRLPGTSSLILDGVDGETLLMNFDMLGFSVSTGAACSSGSPEPSPVLLAMGLSREEAQNSLRVGMGWGTTAEDVERFVAVLKELVPRLRQLHADYQSRTQIHGSAQRIDHVV